MNMGFASFSSLLMHFVRFKHFFQWLHGLMHGLCKVVRQNLLSSIEKFFDLLSIA
jgi:hypothetical protein